MVLNFRDGRFTTTFSNNLHGTGVHNVAKGQHFYIYGDENPTTGYTWNVANDVTHSCGPAGAITFTEHFRRRANPDHLMGVGGTKIIRFTVNPQAKKGSTCTVGFTHAQKWNLHSGWQSNPGQSLTIHIE